MATVAQVDKYYEDAKAIYDSLYSAYFSKPGCGQTYSFPKKVVKSSANANWNCCTQYSSCPPAVDKYNSLIDAYEAGKLTDEYKNDLQNKTSESKSKSALYITIALVIAAAAIGVGTYLWKKYKK